MTIVRRSLAVLTPLFIAGLAAPALAQQAEGFALNRFDPSERGSEWFVLESLDLRGEGRPAAGIVGDWAHKPLVLYAPDGSERKLLVGDQLFVNVGGGVILANRAIQGDGYNLVDVTATILAWYSVPPGDGMTGRSMF